MLDNDEISQLHKEQIKCEPHDFDEYSSQLYQEVVGNQLEVSKLLKGVTSVTLYSNI